MAFALSGAVVAGMLAVVLAACGGGAGPSAVEPVNVRGSTATPAESREGELLLPAAVDDSLLPRVDGVRVSLAKLTWSEEVAAGTEAGDASLFETRGRANEPENVDGD